LGQYKKIITVEDHSIIGGLGTAISEEVAARGIGAQVIRIGLEDKFPESGKPSDLYKKYGLDEEGIISKINLYDK
jgi:transketolase